MNILISFRSSSYSSVVPVEIFFNGATDKEAKALMTWVKRNLIDAQFSDPRGDSPQEREVKNDRTQNHE